MTPRALSGEFPIPQLPARFSLEAVRELLATRDPLQPLLRSVLVACASTALSVALVMRVPAAVVMALVSRTLLRSGSLTFAEK